MNRKRSMETTNMWPSRQIVYIRLRLLFVINLDLGQHYCPYTTYGLYINYFQQIPFPTYNESHVITKHSNRCHFVYTICSWNVYVCVCVCVQPNRTYPTYFNKIVFVMPRPRKNNAHIEHTLHIQIATKKTKESNETINTTQHLHRLQYYIFDQSE